MTQTLTLPPPGLTPASAGRWRLPWASIAAVAILLAYMAYLAIGFSPVVTDPDDNGYFAQGSLLAQTGHTMFAPQSDAQYIGMHWLLTPSSEFISRYPPGLAVVIGVVYALLGYQAATLVNPVLALLTLLGFWWLARRLLPPAWAAVALLLLAVNGTLAQHALSGDSHVAVACCLVWGLYLLLRWAERPRFVTAWVAGLVLGCIPSIRYPEALLGLGAAVFLLWHVRRVPRAWWHVAAAAAGAALPIGALLIRNQFALGAFWRTGYSLTNEQTGFSVEYFTAHALQYIELLCSTGLGPVFLLALLGIAWMICIRRQRGLGLTLASMVIPITLLYMSYYWAPRMNGATMRFLLPEFPLMILAGTWALWQATGRTPRRVQIASAGVLIGVQALLSVPSLGAPLQRGFIDKVPLAELTAAIARTVPPGAVIVADQPNLLQYLDYVRQWKVADLNLVTGQPRGGRMANVPDDQPRPMQAAKQLDLAEKYTGTMRQRQEKYARDVAAWAAGSKIYYVGPETLLRALRDSPLTRDLRVVQTISLPERPVPARGWGMFNGGPGGPRWGGPGFRGPRGGPMAGPGGNAPRFGGGGGMMGRLAGTIVIAEWTIDR